MPSNVEKSSNRRARGALGLLRSWFESSHGGDQGEAPAGVDWPRIIPFVGLHVAALAVFWVGFSWFALALCVATYALRMFAITAFYHRYFAHRAFEAPRVVQFAGAFLGNAAAQRGPLWWAAHHRKHHKHADTPLDVHRPENGFLWAHMGWWADRRQFATDMKQVPDFAKYPELRWLDRYDIAAPFLFALGLFLLGGALESWAPSLETNASQCLVWGFFVSTVVLYHATFTINSLCHRFGRRRYDTSDKSRNNVWLALLTLGEGWHNNHHRYPVSARQGFFWWEVDLSYYALLFLSKLGLVRKLRPVPVDVRDGYGTQARRKAG